MKRLIEWQGEDVLNEIGKRIDANMIQLGQKVVTVAKSLAQVRTGHLRDSIEYDYNLSTHTLVFVVEAEYGIFVEYGTRNMRAHPYLRPALNAVGPIYGFNLEMAFANIPQISNPLLAAGPSFVVPKRGLTRKQRSNIKQLKATSKRLWKAKPGNVSRTAMNPRKHF